MTTETKALLDRVTQQANQAYAMGRFRAMVFRNKGGARGPVQFRIQGRRVSNVGWRVPEHAALYNVHVMSNITGR